MAKKNKKQKTGILKRKQQKKVKKAAQRKQVATRIPQKPQNEKELNKLLSRIPILAYETEIRDMRFDQNALKTLLESDKNDPQILIELLTPEFTETFEKNLNEMAVRIEDQVQKALMVKGILYALENQEMPHFVNPLIVAIYLKTKAEAQGKTMEISHILKEVERYETSNMEFLENLVEEGKKETESLIENEIEDFAPAQELQIDESLLEAYYETLTKLGEEEQERLKEDLEVFLEDYVTVPMVEWNTDLLDDFLGTWFMKNLNPMVEDLVSMQKSLEHFFQFLSAQEKMDKEESQKIIKLLQDEETYKDRMTP